MSDVKNEIQNPEIPHKLELLKDVTRDRNKFICSNLNKDKLKIIKIESDNELSNRARSKLG